MPLKPSQITFRHMDRSAAVEARIQEEAAELERYFSRINTIHVVVEAPHHHHSPRARTYHIAIEISVPGSKIVINHEPSLHSTMVQSDAISWEKHQEAQPDHNDIYVCIRDAFKAARRRLEDYSRILRGDTKHHVSKSESL